MSKELSPEIKHIIKNLEYRVSLLERFIPDWLSLTDIARDLEISRYNLYYYVKTNFERGKEFRLQNRRIYVNKTTFFAIRQKYAK